MKSVVSWTVDDLLESTSGDHVGVVNLWEEMTADSKDEKMIQLWERKEPGRVRRDEKRRTHEDTPCVDG